MEEQKEVTKVVITKFKCKQCNSAQTYVLKDGTRVCRKCGNREVKENAEKSN